jgi:hypothetical protein
MKLHRYCTHTHTHAYFGNTLNVFYFYHASLFAVGVLGMVLRTGQTQSAGAVAVRHNDVVSVTTCPPTRLVVASCSTCDFRLRALVPVHVVLNRTLAHSGHILELL